MYFISMNTCGVERMQTNPSDQILYKKHKYHKKFLRNNVRKEL